MSDFQRITETHAAYDKRDEGYGIHGVEMRFVLKNAAGAVQFVLYTNWQLPSAYGLSNDADDMIGGSYHAYRRAFEAHPLNSPMPADLGYHSPTPVYDDQPMGEACPYLDGRPCYYDGSGLNAWGPFLALLKGGSDGLWECLEEYHAATFAVEVASSIH